MRVLLFFFISIALSPIQAQFGLDSLSIDSLNALGYAPLIRIFDINGQEQSPYQLIVPNSANQVLSTTTQLTCTAGIFELYFEDVADGNGFGFDNATLGTVRQQTVCQVFTDISDFIIPQSPTTKVRINIPASGFYAGTGSKAGEGSSYYFVPKGTTGAMLDGEVWKTINLGFDSWSTLPPSALLNIFLTQTNPSGEFFHGYLKLFFDDNSPVYHYDYTTATSPGLIDFYSLVLHEAIHILGFASLINSTGFSRMASSGIGLPGCNACYTRYDGYLESANTGTAGQLINDANPLSPTFLLTPAQAITELEPGCTSSFFNPIRFNGLNHPNQDVFSPNPFSAGSSLSHFACDCPPTLSYGGTMVACLQLGTHQRFPNQAEADALCDLGYQRGDVWTINGAQATIYTSCTNTPCLAIGANDFEDANGLQYTANIDLSLTPIPITITNLLDNDIFPNGASPQILNGNVQILTGGGSVAVNGNNITYTPSTTFAGWAILAYIPSCPGSLVNGNPTYIFIRVNPAPPPCDNFNCNLICRGNFEEANIAFYRDAVQFNNIGLNTSVFYTINNTPQVQVNVFMNMPFPISTSIINGIIHSYNHASVSTCPFIYISGTAPSSLAPLINNNPTFIQLTNSNGLGPTNGIQVDLVSPLNPSQDYTLTFWAIANPNCTTSPEVFVYGVNTATSTCNNPISLPAVLGTTTTGLCAVQLIGVSTPIPLLPNGTNGAQQWNQYTINISNLNIDNPYNRLYISLQPNNLVNTSSAFLDEFVLTSNNTTTLTINTSTPTPYPCINNQGDMDLVTLNYEVCIDGTIPNANDIELAVNLNGFSVVGGGNFNSQGILTIPAGAQTSACSTYTITLAAPAPPNFILLGVAINFPITLNSIATACIDATTFVNSSNIIPTTTSPLTITKSVSAAPHLVGQPVVYTIEICNSSALAVNGIRVTDNLSSDLTFVSSPNFSYNASSSSLGSASFSLPPALSPTSPSCTTFTFTVIPNTGAVPCAPPHQIKNQASASIFGTYCPSVFSNSVDIFPTTVITIPASITTFNAAIAAGYLVSMPLAATQAQTVVFQNNIIQDVDGYTFFNSDITIAPNVQITVNSSVSFILDNTFVHGCGALWRSITLKSTAKILIGNNSIIQDGFRAIELFAGLGGITVIFTDNATFRNNYISIYAPPTGPTPHIAAIILQNTMFDGGTILPSSFSTGNWAYAGIMLHDFPLLKIANSNNIFQNLANGIIGYRTNIDINRGAIFRNILPRNYAGLPDGNGIYMENIPFSSFSLSMIGLGQTGLPTFNNCHNGIQSIASSLAVLDNNMTNIRALGIESRLGMLQKINITKNNIALRSNLPAVAISLLLNDPTSATLVASNTLHIGIVPPSPPPSTTPVQRGIVVREGSNLHPLTIVQNNIRLFREGTGIDITGNEGARVIGNGINLQQPGSALILRNGIRVSGSENVLLNCNNIGSTLPSNNIFNGALGIDINNSIVTADCNDMTRTDIGMRINGPVCNGSIIRGNSFLRHNTGLLYTGTAITGPQVDAGNEWFGNWANNQRGARHAGGIFAAFSSQYMVVPGQYFPPNVLPGNNDWFIPSGTPAATHLCPNTCTPPLLFAPIALNNVDVAIVNNQIPQNPAGLPWELRKGLYNKLDKNPNFQNISVMGQFYNTYQNQAIGAVVATTDDRGEVLKIDSLDAVALEQLTIAKEFVIDSLGIVDSLYSIGILSQPNWLVHREYLLQQIIQNHQTATTLCNGLYGNCQIKNQQAQTTNASIIYTNTPEENEFLVNEIYLQTVALGYQNFSSAQIQTLFDIAHQCPELGGTAVYRARSIYALVGYDTYEDDCDNLPQARMENLINEDNCYSKVHFLNPSLEDSLCGFVKVPPSWNMTGGTPDIHPCSSISIPPSDEMFYVGVSAISLAPWIESFGQKLVDTLFQNTNYAFLFDLAMPLNVPGLGVSTADISIWLGDSLGKKQQLIYTGATTDTFWRTYPVVFKPNNNYTSILISGEGLSYSFIDNLRPIPQPLCDTITSITPILPDKTDNVGNDVYTNITATEPSKFSIYPNPNKVGLLTIEWQKSISDGVIIVLDALGRQMGQYLVKGEISSQQINIQHLPSGFYTVLLKEEGTVIGREKLIFVKE